MRIFHVLVVAMLVIAAAYVYRIKMDSITRTERVQRLQAELREQRDAIGSLRAEWARLDAPLRLQGLAERHLGMKPIPGPQFDPFKSLPDRPPNFARPGTKDPIGAMLKIIEPDAITGSVPAAEPPQ